MRNFAWQHPRDQIVETMARIYAHDMTTTSGGNLSIRDEKEGVWISPARVDKGRLRAEDVVRVSSGGEAEGLHPPSSEFPFHRAIYEARPDVGAIIHAHPGALVSFSMCGQVPDTRVFPETYALCGKPLLAPYALPGSQALGAKIASAFSDKTRPKCVVLENHGVVVAGKDMAEAFTAFEALEFAAATLLHAKKLGEPKVLESKEKPKGGGASVFRVLPEAEWDGRKVSNLERERRKEVCEFVRRAYDHRLVTSGWGSFSARVGEEAFVITPRHLDRANLWAEDLVYVEGGCFEKGRQPSRAVSLHEAVYRAHPEIGAIVNALPLHASAFSLSDERLDTKTIPESYVFLKEVNWFSFKEQGEKGEVAARKLSVSQPAAVLEHNGVLVAGRSVLDAFDRLEILESTAMAILRCQTLGPVSKMTEDMTRELEEAFGIV
ncbi:MAG: class II aldolase/adducin family protein [Opitutales bacterium]|nr:class II aldolase/adducin family protein [Opitutales bacterium]MCH8540039.1 class II aldolase/adducin family protein [Opitutales bacterium]